jgi:hypothetical protein
VAWGPDKEELASKFCSFSKDPDTMPPELPRAGVEGIGWVIHYYFHRTVHFYTNEAGEECAHFTAREMHPMLWNGRAVWIFFDNDSHLKKIDVTLPTGETCREWRMHVYGLKGTKLVGNADA